MQVPSTCGMAFPRSVVLHFPPEVQRSISPIELVPQLLRYFSSDRVSAIQLLRGGKVRLTFATSEFRDKILRKTLLQIGNISVPVTASDARIRSVYVRDLPFEVPDVDVQSALESFGVVHSVRPCFFRDFPSVANGMRSSPSVLHPRCLVRYLTVKC